MLGADTYFGKDRQASLETNAQQLSEKNRSVSKSPRSATQPSVNPFTSQIKNPGKTEFKQKLCNKLETVPREFLAYLDTPRLEVVDRVINSIDAIRRDRKFGFLPDNQHWRALGTFVDQDKFVLAFMSGQLEASYLALTDAKELEKYIGTLNHQSSEDFRAHVRKQTAQTADC